MNAPPLYLDINGATHGPYVLADVESMWTEGTVTDDTLCCPEGHADWISLRRWVDDFKDSGQEEWLVPPPAAAPQISVRWYLMLAGGTAGPYTLGEVQQVANSALANGATLACQEGGHQWTPLAVALPQIGFVQPAAAKRSFGQGIVNTIHGMLQAGFFVAGICLLILGAISCLTFLGMLWGLPMIFVGAVCLFLSR